MGLQVLSNLVIIKGQQVDELIIGLIPVPEHGLDIPGGYAAQIVYVGFRSSTGEGAAS